MTREETIHRAYEAWSSRDVETIVSMVHPESETRVTDTEDRGDRTLCTIHVRARGRASGAAIEGEMFHVLEFRDGLIWRLSAFLDRNEAVQALEAT